MKCAFKSTGVLVGVNGLLVLTNAVAIVLYEALRKSGLLNNIKID